MSFEVIRVLRQQGAAAHCVVNRWDSSRIVTLAEQMGASWSTGYYWYRFDRHARNPVRWLQLAWDIACTSAGLLRDAWRFEATHLLVRVRLGAANGGPVVLGRLVVQYLRSARTRSGCLLPRPLASRHRPDIAGT